MHPPTHHPHHTHTTHPTTHTPTPPQIKTMLDHQTTDNHWVCDPTTWAAITLQQADNITEGTEPTLHGLSVHITQDIDGLHLVPHPHGHHYQRPQKRDNN